MKKKYLMNRIMAAGLAATMLAGAAMPVMAAETPATGVIERQEVKLENAAASGTGSSLVEYNSVADQTFTVTIPKKIVLSSEKTADYDITVKGDVALGSTVDVVPHDDVNDETGINFNMSVASGKTGGTVSVDVTQADTNWDYAAITANDGAGTAKSGSINGPKLTKGIWSGNLTFDINFNDEYATAAP